MAELVKSTFFPEKRESGNRRINVVFGLPFSE